MGYIAINVNKAEDRPLDFYLENAELNPNIKKESFINDDGLLELI